jgi:uncharacterized protein
MIKVAGATLHPDLTTLIELQGADLKIAELTRQIEALPVEVQTIEAQLSAFLHTHDDRQKRLSANQKERRDLEGEIQAIREKISKHKGQLYEVKTNEQYKAMLKEIEGEESNIRKIEDQILEKMIEAEGIQKLVSESGAKLEAEKSRVAAEKKRLEELRDLDLRERTTLEAHRRELQAKLPEATVVIYERVRRGRGGRAVAEVRDGQCTACNVVLRPQLYNEVRGNESLHTCENCARILFYREPAPAEPQASGEAATAPG